jgi:glutamine synthetase
VSKIKKGIDQIKFVQIRYSDVPGRFLAKYISRDNQEDELFTLGVGFDGSSVRGFAEINESDLLLIPDKNTFVAPIPLAFTTLHDNEVASVIADIYRGFDQGRLNKDP